MPPSLKARRGPSRGSVRLGVEWESPRQAFWESLLVLLRGPAPPAGWPTGRFFRDTWIRGRVPWRTLTLSALWHVAIIVFPLHSWLKAEAPAKESPSTQRLEITWSGTLRDLPAYIPPRARGKSGERNKPLAAKGADAFHPRQTIISAPPKINHPRQTLIQPQAPPEPPKILPPLPNIVQWAPNPQPARPHLQVNARAHLRQRALRRSAPVVAPEVRSTPAPPVEMTFTSSQPDLARPKLEVRAGVRPEFNAQQTNSDAALAPDVSPIAGGDVNGQRLVALSSNPAPPAPILEVPQGNVSARFAISPDGKQPGMPGGTSTGSGGGLNGSGNGGLGGKNGSGIPSISITGGRPDLAGNTSGGTGGLTPGLSTKPKVLSAKPSPGELPSGGRAQQESVLERMKPGAPPEIILDPKRVYTLHVNMPNLTSATGSWVLKFVELEEEEKKAEEPGVATDLAGPLPLRKVDPKYPPALVSARIQGEVVLYAIIRRDGTVDSIQVLQSLDPQLDYNAMQALARWKFRAAERKGKPIELETIVHIPFHPVSSIF